MGEGPRVGVSTRSLVQKTAQFSAKTAKGNGGLEPHN